MKGQQSNIKRILSIITKCNFILYAFILVLISLLMQLLTYVIRIITDHLFINDPSLLGMDINFSITILLTIMGFLLLFEICMVPVFARFSARVSIHIRKSFLWSALNLPLDIYQMKSEGYLMESAGQSISLSYFLSKQMIEVIVRPLLAVYYIVVIAFIYLPCSLITIASVAVMFLAAFISGIYENRIGKIIFDKQSKESGFLLEGLKAIRSIRNSGSEYVFFRDYVDYNRRSALKLANYKRVNKIFSDMPTSIINITKLVLILVGAYGVYDQRITPGQLVEIHGLYSIMAGSIRSTVYSSHDILSVKYQMENLTEINEKAIEAEKHEVQMDAGKKYSKLKGNIIIDHVSFGYNKEMGPVLDDISMEIPAGSSVAIVGASGCGKTTLKKLICSRIDPWDGEILFDGEPVGDIPKTVLVNSIASVDQQIIMFEDTVMNNIKMWDPIQNDADVILAARDAYVHNDIILRDGGYQAVIAEDGSNFSGGQRQRIEIARALSMDPSILILDEATSALDTIVEKRIVDQIQERRITTIVIAHRLSTVRNCDRIYVMDKGHFVGAGTHEELMKKCDLYKTLVTVE